MMLLIYTYPLIYNLFQWFTHLIQFYNIYDWTTLCVDSVPDFFAHDGTKGMIKLSRHRTFQCSLSASLPAQTRGYKGCPRGECNFIYLFFGTSFTSFLGPFLAALWWGNRQNFANFLAHFFGTLFGEFFFRKWSLKIGSFKRCLDRSKIRFACPCASHHGSLYPNCPSGNTGADLNRPGPHLPHQVESKKTLFGPPTPLAYVLRHPVNGLDLGAISCS